VIPRENSAVTRIELQERVFIIWLRWNPKVPQGLFLLAVLAFGPQTGSVAAEVYQ
jgi:hypothetical protein